MRHGEYAIAADDRVRLELHKAIDLVCGARQLTVVRNVCRGRPHVDSARANRTRVDERADGGIGPRISTTVAPHVDDEQRNGAEASAVFGDQTVDRRFIHGVEAGQPDRGGKVVQEFYRWAIGIIIPRLCLLARAGARGLRSRWARLPWARDVRIAKEPSPSLESRDADLVLIGGACYRANT